MADIPMINDIAVKLSRLIHDIDKTPTAEIVSFLDHYAERGQEAENKDIKAYWKALHDAFMKLAEAAGRGPEIADFYDNLETPDRRDEEQPQ